MAEPKEIKSSEEDENAIAVVQDDDSADEEEKTLTHESPAKSKKKKKKSKLKKLLSGKPKIHLADVEDAITSATPEDKKSLSKEEQMKLEEIIKQMNQMVAGGRKDIADHKFWKTQPVIKFGIVNRGVG